MSRRSDGWEAFAEPATARRRIRSDRISNKGCATVNAIHYQRLGEPACCSAGRLGECFCFNRLWPRVDKSDVLVRRNAYFYCLWDFPEVVSSLNKESMEVKIEMFSSSSHRGLSCWRNDALQVYSFVLVVACEVMSSGSTRKCQYLTLIKMNLFVQTLCCEVQRDGRHVTFACPFFVHYNATVAVTRGK